ncbi:MAG TPA: CHASE4 domain-containing protein [Candidatus Acidoferrum sp.]|nr:CHASE4 domain-containing protein [Candidatus Acidoferrum sp.]
MGPIEAAARRIPSSLRGKTLIIIFAIVVALVGGVYLLAREVLLIGYAHIEDALALEDIGRAESALANQLSVLDRNTHEYASWDDTCDFVRGENSSYPRTEFPISTFRQLNLSFVVIFDASGKLVFERATNPSFTAITPMPKGLESHLSPGSLLLSPGANSAHVSGILTLPSGPALVSSRPVLTSNDEGPVEGTLIFGRLLDDDDVRYLSQLTHLTMEIAPAAPASGAASPTAVGKIPAGSFTDSGVTLQAEDGNFLRSSTVVNDIYGKPALQIRVVTMRSILQQARTSLVQFLLLMLATGLVFGSVTLYLLERVVLSRVASLSESITHIGASGDLSGRVTVEGKDEISYLGEAINGMLEDLEHSQRERHEGRARLQIMMEKMPAVLWTTDADLRFTSSMGSGLEALGVRGPEMLGRSLFDYFGTEDPEFPAIVAHRRALAGETVTYELEWDKKIFDSHVSPLRDSEGQLLGVIGVALDITDRRRLTDQLRQSQKMQAIGELAGGIAHDFNNLLMVMKGHAEILLEHLSESSPLQHNAEQVQKAAERAASLTRQLLAFSRRQVLHPRVVDLNGVVSGMIQMFSRTIGENIEMAFRPAASLGRVKADPTQMEQVLLNLVVNARDAMPDGGRLTIETSNVELDASTSSKHAGMSPGRYVMLVVSDTGSGMDQATQARIFEPFFTTKGPGKGTGLGLATVYGVVKQSGGFIWVYSELNRGTTFKIYLPKVEDEVSTTKAEPSSRSTPTGHETILFVEDEESVRELVSEYLKAAGYNVLEAIDGEHALQLATAHTEPIHLLVTDVVMPRLSGRELAVRVSVERPSLKVLYISGYTDDSVFRHGVLEGGAPFLQKPFNLRVLAAKVREVLEDRFVPASPEKV